MCATRAARWAGCAALAEAKLVQGPQTIVALQWIPRRYRHGAAKPATAPAAIAAMEHASGRYAAPGYSLSGPARRGRKRRERAPGIVMALPVLFAISFSSPLTRLEHSGPALPLGQRAARRPRRSHASPD